MMFTYRNMDNQIKIKRRPCRRNTFRSIEYFGIFGIAIIAVLFSYFVCVWAGVEISNIDEEPFRTVWFIGAIFAAIFGKIIAEALTKNSAFYKSMTVSIGGSFLIAVFVDAAIWLAIYFSHSWASMRPFFIDIAVYSVLIPIFRSILFRIYSKKKNDMVIVSTKEEALLIASKMIKSGRSKDTMRVFFVDGVGIDESAIKNAIDTCDILYVGRLLKVEYKNDLMAYATMAKYKQAYIVPNTFEIAALKPDISQADDILMLEAQPLKLTIPQRAIKRAFDVFCSALALIVLSPLIGLTALIIHLQDGGPAIYKQDRVTMNGRVFTLYKFRSMIVNAEQKTGAVLMAEGDSRLTRFGRFIRKTRLDELPQLWNILKGDMSIVGPRPERPVFVNEFLKETPAYAYRFNVRAGLTGYAQVRGNYHTDYADKLRWDLMYIRKYSFLTDVWLIILTVFAVFDRHSSSGTEKKQTPEEFLNECGHKIEKSEIGWTIEGN